MQTADALFGTDEHVSLPGVHERWATLRLEMARTTLVDLPTPIAPDREAQRRWNQLADDCNGKPSRPRPLFDSPGEACFALGTASLDNLATFSFAAREPYLQRACTETPGNENSDACETLGEYYLALGQDASAWAVLGNTPACYQRQDGLEYDCLNDLELGYHHALDRGPGDPTKLAVELGFLCRVFNAVRLCNIGRMYGVLTEEDVTHAQARTLAYSDEIQARNAASRAEYQQNEDERIARLQERAEESRRHLRETLGQAERIIAEAASGGPGVVTGQATTESGSGSRTGASASNSYEPGLMVASPGGWQGYCVARVAYNKQEPGSQQRATEECRRQNNGNSCVAFTRPSGGAEPAC